MKEKIKITKQVRKAYYKNLVATNKATITGTVFDQVELNNGNTIFVAQNSTDNFLHSVTAAPFAAAIKIQLLAGNIVPAIIYDNYFETAPEEVQQFITQHEIGHIVNKDLENPKKCFRTFVKRSFGLLTDFEHKADTYAATMLGLDKYIRALSWMKNNTDLPFLCKLEISNRMKALR